MRLQSNAPAGHFQPLPSYMLPAGPMRLIIPPANNFSSPNFRPHPAFLSQPACFQASMLSSCTEVLLHSQWLTQSFNNCRCQPFTVTQSDFTLQILLRVYVVDFNRALQEYPKPSKKLVAYPHGGDYWCELRNKRCDCPNQLPPLGHTANNKFSKYSNPVCSVVLCVLLLCLFKYNWEPSQSLSNNQKGEKREGKDLPLNTGKYFILWHSQGVLTLD